MGALLCLAGTFKNVPIQPGNVLLLILRAFASVHSRLVRIEIIILPVARRGAMRCKKTAKSKQRRRRLSATGRNFWRNFYRSMCEELKELRVEQRPSARILD